jgi:NADH:ubiquinone oxidoreductase subunit
LIRHRPRAEIGDDARAVTYQGLQALKTIVPPSWHALLDDAALAFAATPDAASVTPDAGERERVRLARELAAYLPKAAGEAEENGWMQWGADFRQAAETILALTADSRAENAKGAS